MSIRLLELRLHGSTDYRLLILFNFCCVFCRLECDDANLDFATFAARVGTFFLGGSGGGEESSLEVARSPK